MKKRLTMLFAALILCIGGVLAQTKVNGTVVSQDDGQPVIGASVLVVGTQVGTVTNANGQFTLTLPEGKKTLRITYVGMEPIEVSARPNMRILLTSDQKALDEVVVVAFGTAKKSAFTGSAKVVGTEELSLSQVSSVAEALAGAVPGVQLTSNNGAPGSESTIRIRGFSSLGASMDPLIIVDGAPYSGDLNNLNPNDVESMTVLKDAASNALYGARGANGVIMITTKRAKQGQDAKVTFDAKWGANSRALQHYDVFKTPQAYYETHYNSLYNYYQNEQGLSANDAWLSANNVLTGSQANGGLGYNIWTVPEGQAIIGRDGKLNPAATLGRLYNYRGEDYWITPDDWEAEGTRTGRRQEYNVNVSGASDKSTFYMSLGYLDNEGITDASDMKRFTGRIRGDYQAKKWLKVGANMSYARFDSNSLGNNGSSSSTGNIWAFTSQIAPIYPIWVRNGDGSIKIDDNMLKMMDYGNYMNAGLTRPFISDANPIMDSRLNTRNNEGNAASAHAFADFTILPGLVFTINGTFNLDETRTTYVYNPYYGQFDTTGGTVEKEHTRTYNYNVQQLLNYNTTIKDHSLGIMLGHEYYDSRGYYLWAEKNQMFSQKNKELNGAVVDGKSSGSYKSRYNNEGYFGRVQYDFNQKYFASASFRRDASSRFDPEYRWGSFWSVGGAWLINKEKWFNASWVDELKVKASYGQQGNDNIGSYRYTDTFSVQNANGQPGTSFNSKGTRDISWETNGNFNAGLEFSLWKGRLTGDIEYYFRKTTDMLFSFSVAPSLGYSSYFDNVGDLYNTGVEAEFTFNAVKTKNIRWDLHLNIATLKNKITYLHADKKTNGWYDTDGNYMEGYSSGSFFIGEDVSMYTWRMKDYAGVNAETGEAQWWKNVYEQTQSKDENGNLLWELTTDGEGNKIQKVDENGNPIAIMEDVWYDGKGNVIADPDNYEGNDKHRKVTGRETTTTYNDGDYYILKQSTMPKFYGGFGTTVKAYGFDFSINCSYQLGGKQYDGTYASFMSNTYSNHTGTNIHRDVLKAWTPENTNSDIPRWQYGDQTANSQSSRFLTDASYLNIENINLGYTLPKSFTKKFEVEALRVYFAAENVYYWSKRKGFDPRQSYSSTTNATYYSPMRTLSGGLTVTF